MGLGFLDGNEAGAHDMVFAVMPGPGFAQNLSTEAALHAQDFGIIREAGELGLPWDELQNTPRHISALSNFLARYYVLNRGAKR